MAFAAFGMEMLETLAKNMSDQYGSGAGLRRQKADEATQDYLKREREGIQARVEGAKAAGLHPLVAMNYQGGNTPITDVGGRQTSGAGAYVQARTEPRDENIDRINAANARRAEAEADQAELATHNAYRALANQPGNGPPVVDTGGNMPTEPQNTGVTNRLPGTKIVANEILSSKNGKTIGNHPGATDVNVPGYGTWTLPSAALNDKLEDVELLKLMAILGLNRGRLWDFFTSDVPWATKGYLQDLRRGVGLPPAGALRRRSQPRRSGGATGSW